MGLPVLRLPSSSTHAVTNTPAEPQTAFRSHSPVTTAFPVLTPGRLPHHPFRGLLSVHSRYGLHVHQVPYRTLYTRGFSRFVTSTTAPVATGRSESCRAGFAPAERQRLVTAHVKLGLAVLTHRRPCRGNLSDGSRVTAPTRRMLRFLAACHDAQRRWSSSIVSRWLSQPG